MLTTLEQAIGSLHDWKQPITLRNTIAAYLTIAGFSGTDVCAEDAMLAFEHALDKHPLPPLCNNHIYHRQFLSEVDRIRKEYWTERSGCRQCVCKKCGCQVVPPQLVERVDNVSLGKILPTKQPIDRKRKVKKMKAARPRSNSSDSDSSRSSGPYAPSTSALSL